MKNNLSKYASLVKFSHTVFAMPFALVGYMYALYSLDIAFSWQLLGQVLLCMIFARNAAMGFNRLVDRAFDAQNPRTASREIPTGVISVRSAQWFVAINVLLFVATTAFINNMAFALSPVAMLVLLGYSYTKRFTAWSHIVLGVALAIAPIGAYIAVAGTIGVMPLLLAGVVMTWVAGFDIIYSLQDREFDRANGLNSVPARFSVSGALVVSGLLHLITLFGVYVMWLWLQGGVFYTVGSLLFAGVLVFQHIAARPSRLDKMGAGFTLINGAASIAYAVCIIVGIVLS